MVNPSHELGWLNFERLLKETREIDQSIGLDIKSMNETTAQTRELIAHCRQAMRWADQFLKTC
jgi:hypothetical protein